ncbi:MAG: mannose-1-phosphate guanylyltransferase/mannose-6-phosphate isomerase [Caulobacteraceae bacterium]
MKCVILAGGVGLRLWPLSRSKYPKQFLAVRNGNTMFKETVLRNRKIADSFMILTNDKFRFIVENQMKTIGIAHYEMLLETISRNTAPAIALACMRSNPEEVLLIVSADAVIGDIEKYYKAVKQAEILAAEGYIVTFGIKPFLPHTGYGYIKYKETNVLAFKEKPDFETAKRYLDEGNYLWNSGIFMLRPDVFLSELKKYQPDLYEACRELYNKIPEKPVAVLEKELMREIPSISADYAVMEHSRKIKVIPSDFKWSDVGSLEAMAEIMPSDQGNNRNNNMNIILNDVKNVSVINKADDQLVVVNGIENTIVVNTKDALYISAYGKSSEIKTIIEKNKEQYQPYFDDNYKVYRPWGFFEVLNSSPTYMVRRVIVSSKRRLSLHKHQYRSEHWIVVKGTATVTIEDKEFLLESKHSIDIPTDSLHRLGNDTENDLEIIEISLGEFISDDDIIRLEDDFKN